MSHISDGVYLCHNCKRRLICPRCTKVDTENNEMKQLRSRVCSLAVVVVAINICFLATFSVPSFSESYIHACKYVCISPKDCFVRNREPEVIESGKRVNEMLCFDYIDQEGRVNFKAMESVTCELTHESTGNAFECEVIETGWNKYEISYQPTSRRRHQLHIKVEGEHIKGSPFPVTVMRKLVTPIKTISGLKYPWGVAVNQREEILVAENGVHRVSIFSPTGEKLRSFGSQGSGPGQFYDPHGVAVDDDGNILVTDWYHIQKISSEQKYFTKQLSFPCGVAISPTTKKIVVTDWGGRCVQILNADLTLNSSIGSKGNGSGQFNHPYDIAFDSAGNTCMYVTDMGNHCIQVFNPEGKYLRQFGKKGSDNGEMNSPTGISIDSDDIVYVAEYDNHRVSVFTLDGKFLSSFGSWGDGPGQFKNPHGITVDSNGVIYVSDSGNDRIQIF